MRKRTLFLTLLLVFFSLISTTNASTIFTDDFNSYVNGNLGGQGGWVGSSSNTAVQSSILFEGSKAVSISKIPPGMASMEKKGITVNSGQIVLHVRGYIGGTTHPSFNIQLKENDNTRLSFKATTGSPFSYYNSDVSGYTSFNPLMISEQWYKIQIEWRGSDHKARYRVNDGNFTDWRGGFGDWILGLNTIRIDLVDGLGYVDLIEEGILENSKNPVLIIPGLMGTEIKNGDDLLWLDLDEMLLDVGDEFLDDLQFNSNLTPTENLYIANTIKRIEPAIGLVDFDYIDGLIKEFKRQEYVENETLFTFPYDWRYGVSGKFEDGTTVIDLLKQKIEQIIQETGKDRVDVVAHSMGGLLLKKYVMENHNNHYIDKVVFVGVPNNGAPTTIKTLIEGDDFGIPWLSQKEIKKIAKNMPSAYDLLPSQEYYNNNGSFVKTIDERKFLLSSPEITVNDLNYNEFEDYITQDHQLNNMGFNNSQNLHSQNFDNFDLRSAGINFYSINGCKSATVGNIIERKTKDILGFESTSYNLGFRDGDGTVPLESANSLPINQENIYYSLFADHSKMLSQNGVLQQIVNIVSGSGLDISSSSITQDEINCSLKGDVISIFSPINVSVQDQYGNYTGLAEDESIKNEIPGASLEIIGDHKFLYLPNDQGQTYQISIDGTGEGIYTIKRQKIENNEVSEMQVFSNLHATNNLTGQIHLGETATLVIKKDSESIIETINPSSVVYQDETEDIVGPISSVELRGIMGDDGFCRSGVNLRIKTIDDVSGVLGLHYNVNNSDYSYVVGDNVDLNFTEEGIYSISIFSTDEAGNNEPEKIVEFKIDKTAPEAEIKFDKDSRGLKFIGIDNISSSEGVLIEGSADKVIITDEAVNIT